MSVIPWSSIITSGEKGFLKQASGADKWWYRFLLFTRDFSLYFSQMYIKFKLFRDLHPEIQLKNFLLVLGPPVARLAPLEAGLNSTVAGLEPSVARLGALVTGLEPSVAGLGAFAAGLEPPVASLEPRGACLKTPGAGFEPLSSLEVPLACLEDLFSWP